MLVGSGRSRRWNGRALALGFAAAASVIGLGGCSSLNPFDLYRDVTGASKDDPGKDEANTANLEAGSQEPYPAVGSVPEPPTRGLTEAQRQKLAEGLVADRNNARYIDDQITNGNSAAVMPPQVPVPEEQLPIAIPASPPSTAPAAPPTVPTPRPPAQSRSSGNFVTGGFLGHSGESLPARTPVAPPAPVGADKESSLQTPAPRAVPEAETPQTPPPPPALKPLPPPQAPSPLPGAPALPPKPPEPPTQVAGIPVPPPPPSRPEPVANPPAVAAAPTVSTAVNLPTGKHAKSAQIAEVGFVAGANALSPEAPTKLKDVPALHQQYGGVVRVVGYASLPQGGTDPAGQQLAAYQSALQRARLVKQALVDAGVPAADIVTEASPVHGTGAAADRADVYAEY
jgi:outer membrane protein OmpA-like peptidoglycan-associated protein